MLSEIIDRVYRANMALKESQLVVLTWGNVSEIDRMENLVVIKPSGVDYQTMRAEDMVVTDLDGNMVQGTLKPSSDLLTHLQIYKSFPKICAVAHTHSKWATVFAQAGQEIPILGTTHADTFYGDIPCTRAMTPQEIAGDYERETGNVIVERFRNLDPVAIPGVIVCSHGPFTFGKTALDAVQNAIVLEEAAMMAWHTLQLNPDVKFQQELADKHYYRKHGANAYYGQVDHSF